MAKEIIKKGTIIRGNGEYFLIAGRNEGGLFWGDSWNDGDMIGEESWKTLSELEQMLKDCDGKNHRLVWDDMVTYQVDYTDPVTGACSPIDKVEALPGYTAEEYILDCEMNADPEWVEMLHAGTVELWEVE